MMRAVMIEPVLNGFVVRVGCQTVVFESVTHLTSTLDKYLRNPEEVEAVWTKESINAKHKMAGVVGMGTAVGSTEAFVSGSTLADHDRMNESVVKRSR